MATLRMTPRGAVLIVTALLVSSGRSFLAQPQDVPTFEVVSIKPSNAGDDRTASFVQWTQQPLAPNWAPAGVSLFTALREQLGLRLESQRDMVDVLVVAGVERPGPD